MTPRDKLYSTINRVIISTVWLRFLLIMPILIGYTALFVYVMWTVFAK